MEKKAILPSSLKENKLLVRKMHVLYSDELAIKAVTAALKGQFESDFGRAGEIEDGSREILFQVEYWNRREFAQSAEKLAERIVSNPRCLAPSGATIVVGSSISEAVISFAKLNQLPFEVVETAWGRAVQFSEFQKNQE
jgi:hypothetical protein